MKNDDDKREMYGAHAETEKPGARRCGIGADMDGEIDAWDDEIDPRVEDAYWRENYTGRPYVTEGETYDLYAAAYRTGYENFNRYSGLSFDEIEGHLRQDYEQHAGTVAMTWEKAKQAARDAWHRLEDYLPGAPDDDRR